MTHKCLKFTAVASLAWSAACLTAGGGGVNFPSSPPPNPDQVRVRILNNTLHGLNPQLYVTASENALELFNAGNQLSSFGVAGTGLVDALNFAVIDFACDRVRYLGTAGGLFFEANSAAEAGHTGQLTAARELDFNCGDTVTLTFSMSVLDEVFAVDLRRE